MGLSYLHGKDKGWTAKRRWSIGESIHHYHLIRHKSVILGAIPFTERMSSLDFIFKFYTSSIYEPGPTRLLSFESPSSPNLILCVVCLGGFRTKMISSLLSRNLWKFQKWIYHSWNWLNCGQISFLSSNDHILCVTTICNVCYSYCVHVLMRGKAIIGVANRKNFQVFDFLFRFQRFFSVMFVVTTCCAHCVSCFESRAIIGIPNRRRGN